MNRLQQIRESERSSHIHAYSSFRLYKDESWLKKPVKTVLDLLPYFSSYPSIRVLDLGCGVGRNSIAVAGSLSHIPCRIDCVDILPLAIRKLLENARTYHVSESICGYPVPLDSFPVPENTYDLVLAVSALEHSDSEELFLAKLDEIKKGIRAGGIFCLIMNTDVHEYDSQTGMEIPAQFEVNLSEDMLRYNLYQIFCGWQIMKDTSQKQRYDIPRDSTISDLHTTVVTYVVKKD